MELIPLTVPRCRGSAEFPEQTIAALDDRWQAAGRR
jgi:hypothetical protein